MCSILILFSALLSTSASAGVEYGKTVFYGDVSMGTWSNTVTNITISTATGGTYTNLDASTNCVIYTNYYRLSATNLAGRIPASTNVAITFQGTTNNTTNAVSLTWSRYEGISSYIVERSIDSGATWTNWLALSLTATNWTDTGTNSWTPSSFPSLYSLISAPSVPWGGTGTYATAAQGAKADTALQADGSVVGDRLIWGGGVALADLAPSARGSSFHGLCGDTGRAVIGANSHGSQIFGCVDGYGEAILSANAVGSFQLVNIVSGLSAYMVGSASIGLGACSVWHNNALVAGDGQESHGDGTVNAAGFWANGSYVHSAEDWSLYAAKQDVDMAGNFSLSNWTNLYSAAPDPGTGDRSQLRAAMGPVYNSIHGMWGFENYVYRGSDRYCGYGMYNADNWQYGPEPIPMWITYTGIYYDWKMTNHFLGYRAQSSGTDIHSSIAPQYAGDIFVSTLSTNPMGYYGLSTNIGAWLPLGPYHGPTNLYNWFTPQTSTNDNHFDVVPRYVGDQLTITDSTNLLTYVSYGLTTNDWGATGGGAGGSNFYNFYYITNFDYTTNTYYTTNFYSYTTNIYWTTNTYNYTTNIYWTTNTYEYNYFTNIFQWTTNTYYTNATTCTTNEPTREINLANLKTGSTNVADKLAALAAADITETNRAQVSESNLFSQITNLSSQIAAETNRAQAAEAAITNSMVQPKWRVVLAPSDAMSIGTTNVYTLEVTDYYANGVTGVEFNAGAATQHAVRVKSAGWYTLGVSANCYVNNKTTEVWTAIKVYTNDNVYKETICLGRLSSSGGNPVYMHVVPRASELYYAQTTNYVFRPVVQFLGSSGGVVDDLNTVFWGIRQP